MVLQRLERCCLLAIGGMALAYANQASAQNCQALMNAVAGLGPGYGHYERASALANTYNAHCLGTPAIPGSFLGNGFVNVPVMSGLIGTAIALGSMLPEPPHPQLPSSGYSISPTWEPYPSPPPMPTSVQVTSGQARVTPTDAGGATIPILTVKGNNVGQIVKPTPPSSPPQSAGSNSSTESVPPPSFITLNQGVSIPYYTPSK